MAKKKCQLLVKVGNVYKRGYLRTNNSDKVLIFDDASITKYTLTVVPTPNDAKVRFLVPGYKQTGNSITVPYGTEVTFEVSKPRYTTDGDTVTVTEDASIPFEIYLRYNELDIVDYNYTNIDDNLTLTKYIGTSTDVVVPNVTE